MPFKSVFDYLRFAERVIDNTRYRYGSEDEEFLKTVEESGSHRAVVLPAETALYRAQLNHGIQTVEYHGKHIDFPLPSASKRMKPLPRSAKEGRVNPKGIPCLYLADKRDTAMSEVRPWIGAHVSLGSFVTVKDLRVMDCTARRSLDLWALIKGGPTTELEESVWGEISNAFSEPVTDSEAKAGYVPTQILAEVFKRMGCDGIKYRSLLGEGGNSFALFNLNDARLVSCGLCTIESISHKFSEEVNVYDVRADGSEVSRDLPPGS